MPSPPANPFLAAALDYARRGWRVVPLAAKDKRPWVKDWVHAATTSEEQLRKWWIERAASNVGVALGSASGLVAIDVDTAGGAERLLAMAGGEWPATCEMTTGKGSRLLFALPEGLGFEPIQVVLKGSAGEEELRLQAKGGQCVMPPSVHPNGKTYAWVDGRAPTDLAPAPMPAWLTDAMRPAAEVNAPAADAPEVRTSARPTNPDEHPATPPPLHEPAAATYFDAGGEFNRHGDWWTHILSPAQFKPDGKSPAGVLRFTRPGKDSGVSVTVGHYKARDGSPALYVFSGSIPELPAGKCFDKFGAYTRLFHGGNFKLAAEALGRMGFGTPRPAGTKPGAKANAGEAPPVPTEPVEWPDPLPLRVTPPATPFPLDVFPKDIQEFAASVALLANVPVGYVAANLLGVAAGAIGATLTVALTEEWHERACLFVAVVAPKSAGKTPAHLAAMKPLRRIQAERARTDEKAVLFTTDTTVEAIAPLLRDRPRGLLVAADELSGFIGGMNQYKPGGKGGDRAFWLSCWAGTTLSVLRRNPDAPHLWVPHPCVSVLGGVQPAVLADAFGTDDGLAERFLFECSDPLPSARASKGKYRHADRWHALIDRMATLQMAKGEHGPHPLVVPLADDAWDVFADWTAECGGPADRDQTLDGYRAKAKGYAGRLALVLHALRHAEPAHAGAGYPRVSGQTMADAVRLGRYYLAQVDRLRTGVGGGQSDAERVLAWLARCGKPAVTRRDVQRGLQRQFPKAEMLADPLRRLVQHGWVRYADVPSSAGRPAEALYELRPDLCQRCQQPSPGGADTSFPYGANT